MPPPTVMKNVRDLSSRDAMSPGFQFEFFCQGCDYAWRTKFKPYRTGQLTGWLTRFAFMFSDLSKAGKATGAFSDAGSRAAKEEAFEAAQLEARQYFHQCPKCKRHFCGDCWDEDQGECKECVGKAQGRMAGAHSHGGDGGVSGQCCPNCQTPTQGGRFCPECGFDMASTHKSCPSCGSVMPRSARFCTDCGHGF